MKTLKRLKVLLVEDDEALSRLLKQTLGEHFALFEVCSDALCALDVLKKRRFDIIISDIMMPHLSGLEFATRLREDGEQAHIILISAYSEQEKLLDAIEAGVNKYFIKPFDPEELLAYIVKIEPKLKDVRLELVDDFVYNASTKALYKKDRFISLSKNEINFFDLLSCNEVVSDGEIKMAIWGESASDERLRAFIKRLRAKSSKDLILNIKGVGYELNYLKTVRSMGGL